MTVIELEKLSKGICHRGHSRLNNVDSQGHCKTCEREPERQWYKMKWELRKRIQTKRDRISQLERELDAEKVLYRDGQG